MTEWHKLHIDKKSGILYRRQRVVLPQKFKCIVYRELHEEMGHLGVEGILALARERFYWRNMRRDVEQTLLLSETEAPLQPAYCDHSTIATVIN